MKHMDTERHSRKNKKIIRLTTFFKKNTLKQDLLHILICAGMTFWSIDSFAEEKHAMSLESIKKNIQSGQLSLQFGGYWRTQASPQFIRINGIIGDQFTVNQGNHSNGLFGVGYFLNGEDHHLFQFSYGISAYYLPKTSITGTVIQEENYPNLTYGYAVTQYPLYAMLQSKTKLPQTSIHSVFNIGIGPNFMTTSHFNEQANTESTLPDQIFSGKTTTTFSVTAGAGLELPNVFHQLPLICGYQFYYLGQGQLSTTNNQVQNTLKSGVLYANAVICGIKI